MNKRIGKKQTGATLCAGGEGVGIGMIAAGIDHVWGIEINDAIAQVARDNGFNVITGDICKIDPATLPKVDNLHASLPCITASQANQSAEVNEDGLKESRLDMALARATIGFIEVINPRCFTLENVWGYRNYQSFKGGDKCEGIVPALERLGYKVGYWHLNAADYGVPQTRKRLVLIARKDKKPIKPPATHRKPTAQMTLFDKPWNGWLSAVADIVHLLPESKFADWQLERLPVELRESLLIGGANTSQGQAAEGVGVSDINEPTRCVNASNSNAPRAFIVDCQNGSEKEGEELRGLIVKGQGEPMFSLTGTQYQRPARAYLVGDQQEQLVEENNPANTVRSGQNGGASPRALLPHGRVIKMTPRALARFQSFPDWYELPKRGNVELKNPIARAIYDSLYEAADDSGKRFLEEWKNGDSKLACRVIGNAVPPLLAQKIYESILKL